MPISRRTVIVSLLCVGIVCSFLFFDGNIDRSIHALRTHDAEVLMVSKSQEDLYKDFLEEEDRRRNAELDEFMNSNGNSFACLKNSSATSSTKEQLENFVEGDCAPVIVLPGLMGTKLMVEIDCETLQEKHPEIMKACGWSTCSHWWSRLFGTRPDDEYLMWIPKILSPMSIFTLHDHSCFGKLIQVRYNKSKEHIYEKYSDVEGVKISWYGNTPGTYKDADGGFNAVSNIFPLPFQTGDTKEWYGLAQYLTGLGYQKGLSLFAVPYDFRLTHLANSVAYTLERTIRYAYELTGKKVIIVAHSLGNLNTLPVLNSMSQADKDRMIATYVAVTPPFGGAAETVRLFLGGNKDMIMNKFFGFKFANQRGLIGAAGSGCDLLPKDAFTRFRKEPWMQDLLKRIQMENKIDPNTEEGAKAWNSSDVPYPFFPPPTEKCFEGFTERPEECKMLVTDLNSLPTAVVDDEPYYPNNASMKHLLGEHFTMNRLDDMLGMYNDSLANGVHKFENPQVPVVYVYETHRPTEIENKWKYNPEDNTLRGGFAFPNETIKKHGDTTVEVSYALPIALKWAWEHTHGVNQSKPIKIVEFCSSYNQKDSLWDTYDENGTNYMNTTEYVGATCDCWESLPGSGSDCTHTNIVGDPWFIDIIGDLIWKREAVSLNTTAAYRLSEGSLKKLKHELPHLRRPREEQDVKIWLQSETALTE